MSKRVRIIATYVYRFSKIGKSESASPKDFLILSFKVFRIRFHSSASKFIESVISNQAFKMSCENRPVSQSPSLISEGLGFASSFRRIYCVPLPQIVLLAEYFPLIGSYGFRKLKSLNV